MDIKSFIIWQFVDWEGWHQEGEYATLEEAKDRVKLMIDHHKAKKWDEQSLSYYKVTSNDLL